MAYTERAWRRRDDIHYRSICKSRMPTNTHFISDELHYREVVERMVGVNRELWIGTADIKDVYVKKGRKTVPLLGVLASLLELDDVSAGACITTIYGKICQNSQVPHIHWDTCSCPFMQCFAFYVSFESLVKEKCPKAKINRLGQGGVGGVLQPSIHDVAGEIMSCQ